MGGSGDTPRGEPPATRDDDLDAVWRRGARSAHITGRERPRRPSDLAAGARPERASPWSRQAIEAPLPTIGEIRERWRTELGLEDAGEGDGVAVRLGHGRFAPQARRDDVATAGSTTTGDVVLAGLLVGASVVLALVAMWFVRPAAGGVPADRMPAAVTPRWSASVAPLRPDDVAVGDGTVAVVEDDVLVVRALDDGVELWRQDRSAGLDHEVAIFGDAIVVVGGGPIGEEIATFDVADGGLRWQRPQSPDSRFEFVRTGVVEFVGRGAEVVAQVLDLGTGSALGPGVNPTDDRVTGAIVGRVGGDLAVLDLASGRVVDPTVPAFGLRAIAQVGDAVVGLTEAGDIVLFDADGEVVDQRPFVSDAFGDFDGRAELFGGVPGTSIGIVASGTSIGFEVGTGRIDQRWEIDGRVLSAAETSIGPLGLARLVDPDDGDISMAVVDLVDGSTVAVTDADGDREGPAELFADGYVVPPAIGDPERTIEAFGYDGAQRWSFDLGPGGAWYVVDHRALVVADEGEITVHR